MRVFDHAIDKSYHYEGEHRLGFIIGVHNEPHVLQLQGGTCLPALRYTVLYELSLNVLNKLYIVAGLVHDGGRNLIIFLAVGESLAF